MLTEQAALSVLRSPGMNLNTAKLYFAVLLDAAGRGEAWSGNASLADRAGICRRSVTTGLGQLAGLGLVRVVPNPKLVTGRAIAVDRPPPDGVARSCAPPSTIVLPPPSHDRATPGAHDHATPLARSCAQNLNSELIQAAANSRAPEAPESMTTVPVEAPIPPTPQTSAPPPRPPAVRFNPVASPPPDEPPIGYRPQTWAGDPRREEWERRCMKPLDSRLPHTPDSLAAHAVKMFDGTAQGRCRQAVKKHGIDRTRRAMAEAHGKNARESCRVGWGYVVSILNAWERDGMPPEPKPEPIPQYWKPAGDYRAAFGTPAEQAAAQKANLDALHAKAAAEHAAAMADPEMARRIDAGVARMTAAFAAGEDPIKALGRKMFRVADRPKVAPTASTGAAAR